MCACVWGVVWLGVGVTFLIDLAIIHITSLPLQTFPSISKFLPRIGDLFQLTVYPPSYIPYRLSLLWSFYCIFIFFSPLKSYVLLLSSNFFLMEYGHFLYEEIRHQLTIKPSDLGFASSSFMDWTCYTMLGLHLHTGIQSIQVSSIFGISEICLSNWQCNNVPPLSASLPLTTVLAAFWLEAIWECKVHPNPSICPFLHWCNGWSGCG